MDPMDQDIATLARIMGGTMDWEEEALQKFYERLIDTYGLLIARVVWKRAVRLYDQQQGETA